MALTIGQNDIRIPMTTFKLLNALVVLCVLAATGSCNGGTPANSTPEPLASSTAPSTTTNSPITSNPPDTNRPTTTPSGTEPSPASDFVYIANGEGITITEYIGLDMHVIIPDKIDGKKVTSIGEGAFYQHAAASTINTVIVPDGVVSIGARAFANLHNLYSITLPSSVTNIGNGAFICVPAVATGWPGGYIRCLVLTVSCPRDSYAHQYCIDNNITFELTD